MIKVQKNTFYSIALPIGNSEDLSENTKDILQQLDVIACEDTRTFKLLSNSLNLNMRGKIIAYHEHNEPESAQGLLQLLQDGCSVGLVTDAGTPNVSDPGYNILKLCFENNISILPLPGPSSLTAALSVCPIGGRTHFFAGFAASKQKERYKEFQQVSTLADKIIFFESPHRLLDHLKDAQNIWQTEKAFIAREISKPHQQYLWANLSELISYFTTHSAKGEFVVIYPKAQKAGIKSETLEREIKQLLSQNIKDSEIAKALRNKAQVGKKTIYDMIQRIKSEMDS